MAIYNGKHVVFEQVGVNNFSTLYSSSNTDSDGCVNNYEISLIRNTRLPSLLSYLSTKLQTELTNTTVQTAKNGTSDTLISTSDKIFIPAQKEMSTVRSFSRQAEFDALTTWNYYTTHTSNSDRIKYNFSSSARSYWLRSPRVASSTEAVPVLNGGSFSSSSTVSLAYDLSPCFAF